MAEDDDAVLLKDQKKFMSLNSLVMYGATRTYPEILPATKLASKYNKATEMDMNKLNRVADYIYGCAGRHEYVLAPKSLQVVSCADAAYASHVLRRIPNFATFRSHLKNFRSLAIYIEAIFFWKFLVPEFF
jgi:hypothetical protein